MSEPVSHQLPFFTLSRAAREAGVSKPTLSKAIKEGRLSAEKQPDGSYRIQPAELFRVYPPQTPLTRSSRSEIVDRETGKDINALGEQVAVLLDQLSLLTGERERERQQLTEQIEDLRRRLDQSEAERRDKDRQLTAVLTDQRPKDEAPDTNAGRGFWARLRRKA